MDETSVTNIQSSKYVLPVKGEKNLVLSRQHSEVNLSHLLVQ